MMSVLGTFVGVLAFVLGACWAFVVRAEAGAHKALQKRLRPQEEAARKGRLTIATSEQRQRGLSLFKGVQSLIDQSGRKTTVPRVLFTCFISGFVTGLLTWNVLRQPLAAAAAALIAMMVPYGLLKHAASKRM